MDTASSSQGVDAGNFNESNDVADVNEGVDTGNVNEGNDIVDANEGVFANNVFKGVDDPEIDATIEQMMASFNDQPFKNNNPKFITHHLFLYLQR